MRSPPLILIVDDNPTNIDILQKRLTANHYEIITAADGEAGLSMAKSKKPDLILLDIMMPKMDGLEVCRRLKQDASLPFMPIILVTAKADSKDVVAGLEAGGDEYLTKPVNHAALVARVKSMLRIKSLHDTVVEQSAELKRQVKTATKIQSLFWPDMPALEPGTHIWGVSEPAAYVGGDLYDVIRLSDGSLLAYVADVSDKGVPAALIMAALSTKIKAEARNTGEVDKLLQALNNSLYRLIAEEGYFATIVIARYWPANGKAELALGGHLQPIWFNSRGIEKLSQLNGIAMGVRPDARFDKYEFVLSPGESILFFTDGVIEAENEANELFGNQKLIDIMRELKAPPCGEEILNQIKIWRGNAKSSDDLTILEIWRDAVESFGDKRGPGTASGAP